MKVTQAEFARLCGVNKSTVTRWIQNGRIERDAHGLIDPEAAAEMRAATESPMPHHQARKDQLDEMRASGAFSGPGEYHGTAQAGIAQHGATVAATDGVIASAARQSSQTTEPMPAMEKLGQALKLETYKLQKAKAERENMALDKESGALVERAEVDYVLADFGNSLRGLLEGLPDRMTHECLRIRDAAEMHKHLADTMADILTEMADLMKRKMETA